MSFLAVKHSAWKIAKCEYFSMSKTFFLNSRNLFSNLAQNFNASKYLSMIDPTFAQGLQGLGGIESKKLNNQIWVVKLI